jgi:hypothetical protein
MRTRQLARLLRKSHRKTRSWAKTGEAFEINKGLAFKIATQDYDPADPSIRERLGLGPRPCPTCHRKQTVPRGPRPKPIRKFGWMWDVKPQSLLEMLNRREVMK